MVPATDAATNSENTSKTRELVFDVSLLEILACPCEAHGALTLSVSKNELRCTLCRRIYPIVEGIPVLLMDEARTP